MQHDTAAMRGSAVLEQVDSLPGSQRHSAADYRNRKVRLGERGPDMSGHVVGALSDVLVIWIVFGNQALEKIGEVADHVGIGVFLNGERRGGVLHENRQQTGLRARGSQPGGDFAGERMQTLAARPDFKRMSELIHSTVTLLARFLG